jgi:hypothetical protein
VRKEEEQKTKRQKKWMEKKRPTDIGIESKKKEIFSSPPSWEVSLIVLLPPELCDCDPIYSKHTQ